MSVEHGISNMQNLSILCNSQDSNLKLKILADACYDLRTLVRNNDGISHDDAVYYMCVRDLMRSDFSMEDDYAALNTLVDSELDPFGSSGVEMEHKYLIEYPDIDLIKSQPDCSVINIVQTYLTSHEGETRRVRRWEEDGCVLYFKTVKKRINNVSAEEKETMITLSEYSALIKEADPELSPIEKTRYRVPAGNETAEIDVYVFWNDKAVCEVEVESEEEEVTLPSFIRVIKEVTSDRAYKNVSLARNHNI